MSISADQGELVRFVQSPAGYGYRGREKPGDLLDIRELWKLLSSHGRLAASVFAATMLAALLYLLIVPPIYSAISVIHVDPRQQRVITSKTVLSGIGADAAAVESQVELIRSTTAARKVIEQLGLLNDPEFTRPFLISFVLGSVLPDWGEKEPAAAARRLRNEVITRFLDQLSVSRRGLTYIIEVKFDSVDAEKAARIANALADAYLDGQLATKSNAAASASEWLTERIGKLRGKVSDSERAIANYKAEQNIIDIGAASSGLTLINSQIEQSNQQLILARTQEVEANAEYDQVRRITEQKIDPGSLSDALKSDVIADLRVKYSTVARLESEYSATYGPGHPWLKRIRSQLATMHREIKQELNRILVSKKNEHEIAITRVGSLASRLKALEQKSLRFNKANVRLAELQREAQANRDLFEQILSREKETNEQRSLKNSDARIVANAIMPVEPDSPKIFIVLLIAAVSGMGLSVSGAVLRQHLDRSYRRKADLERDTGVMCLGFCPAVEPRDVGVSANGHNHSRFRLPKRLSVHNGDGVIEKENGFSQLVSRIVLDQPASSYADAIRSIRFNCKAADPDRDSKILLVSSALPGEGKSTLAANLARSLAKNGDCTLLIDADIKTRSLSRLLAWNDAQGLNEVLSNQRTFRETAICEPGSTMFFLPVGRNHMNGDNTDILADDRFRQFLRSYRDNFDYIVIDGSPVLSTADGRVLFRHADAALFVVEWGKTEDEAVIAAMGTLGPMRGKIMGTILNKVDPDASDAYRYDNSISRS